MRNITKPPRLVSISSADPSRQHHNTTSQATTQLPEKLVVPVACFDAQGACRKTKLVFALGDTWQDVQQKIRTKFSFETHEPVRMEVRMKRRADTGHSSGSGGRGYAHDGGVQQLHTLADLVRCKNCFEEDVPSVAPDAATAVATKQKFELNVFKVST